MVDLSINHESSASGSRPNDRSWGETVAHSAFCRRPVDFRRDLTREFAVADYSEAFALLPHSYQPHGRKAVIGPALNRASVGLPQDGFVFCCFNQAYKLTPDIFDVLVSAPRSPPNKRALAPRLQLCGGQSAQRSSETRDRRIAPGRPAAEPTSRTSSARRSLARHGFIRRAHHCERCFVGRCPADHTARRNLCIASGGKFPVGDRASRTDRRSRRRLLRSRPRSRLRPCCT